MVFSSSHACWRLLVLMSGILLWFIYRRRYNDLRPLGIVSAILAANYIFEKLKYFLFVFSHQDVEVNEAFQKLLQKVHDSGRSLEVLHGGRVRHDAPHIRRVVGKGPAMGDPMIILMDYIRQRNLRMMDLFTQFDKDNSWSVTRREFKRGMRVSKHLVQVDLTLTTLTFFCIKEKPWKLNVFFFNLRSS